MNKFTSANILKAEASIRNEHGDISVYYDIGNTDSDVGGVVVNLYSFDDEAEPNRYDFDIEIETLENWGLVACASAMLVVAEDFPKRFPQYELTDNTGMTL
jgi:hypothetical protein